MSWITTSISLFQSTVTRRANSWSYSLVIVIAIAVIKFQTILQHPGSGSFHAGWWLTPVPSLLSHIPGNVCLVVAVGNHSNHPATCQGQLCIFSLFRRIKITKMETDLVRSRMSASKHSKLASDCSSKRLAQHLDSEDSELIKKNIFIDFAKALPLPWSWFILALRCNDSQTDSDFTS